MNTDLLNLTKEGLNGLLKLIYPPACGICGKKLLSKDEENLSICLSCANGIKKNLPPYCEKCGRSLTGLVKSVKICAECYGRDFYYDRTWSAFLYEGVVKEALHLLKYSKKLSLARLFCKLLAQFVWSNPEILNGVDAVLSVPLHSVKLREREFNQAHILAEAVIKDPAPLNIQNKKNSKRCGIKDLSHCLKRTVATRPQNELDKKERFNNVKDTFAVAKPKLLAGRNLLLVDDLFTTGATLNECAKVLKKAGARKIHCLTFARGV